MPQKLIDLFQSRKFWSLVAAIVTVAALSAYAVATGIEAAGQSK